MASYKNMKTNITAVENELFTKLKNLDLNIKDARLFVEINNNNLYPIDISMDSTGNVCIDDVEEAKNKNLYIGTKRQFLYKQYKVSSLSTRFNLDDSFKSGWNPKNYIVFLNGYKLHSATFQVACPTLKRNFNEKTIYSLKRFHPNDRLDVFYIESDNDYFKNIDCAQSESLKVHKVTTNQRVIDIPYPYKSYINSSDSFMVFDCSNKKFLALDKDYKFYSSNNSAYIVLERTTVANDSTFLFIFTETNGFYGSDTVQDVTNMIIHKGTGSSKSGNNITFSPSFDEYTLDKSNVLLFCDGELVKPSEYSITSNSVFNINNAKSYNSYYYLAIKMIDYNNLENSDRFFEIDKVLVS